MKLTDLLYDIFSNIFFNTIEKKLKYTKRVDHETTYIFIILNFVYFVFKIYQFHKKKRLTLSFPTIFGSKDNKYRKGGGLYIVQCTPSLYHIISMIQSYIFTESTLKFLKIKMFFKKYGKGREKFFIGFL